MGHSWPLPIMIRNQNQSQEPPESSTTPDQEFEDMRVLCTFLFNVEGWISEHRLFAFWSPLKELEWKDAMCPNILVNDKTRTNSSNIKPRPKKNTYTKNKTKIMAQNQLQHPKNRFYKQKQFFLTGLNQNKFKKNLNYIWQD